METETITVLGKHDKAHHTVTFVYRVVLKSPWRIQEFLVKQLSDEWFALRRKRITASVAGEAVGLGGNGLPSDLWRFKRFFPDQEKEDTPDMSEGRRNEGPTADKCAKFLGGGTELEEVGIFGFERWNWLLASPDRRITKGPHAGKYIEVKYSIRTLYEEPKLEHLVQTHVQMHVLNQSELFLIYGFTDGSVNIFLVHWSQAFWDWLEERLERFAAHLDSGATTWPSDDFIPAVHHETKDHWKSGQVPSHWRRSCKCNYHKPRPCNSPAQIRHLLEQGKQHCSNLAPRVSYVQLFKGLVE
jgi:hypothetical protein